MAKLIGQPLLPTDPMPIETCAAAQTRRPLSVPAALDALLEALALQQRQPLQPNCSDPSNQQCDASSSPVSYSAGACSNSDSETILAKRRQLLGPNMALFFQDEPLHIVRGRGCEIFEADGHAYLDCINNVSHVGHAHPYVAAKVAQQLFTLNTNSRYLHESLNDLAERLCSTMPSSLQVVFPVSSGSEANDLAWRIACTVAAKKSEISISKQDGHQRPPVHTSAAEPTHHVAVLDHAYHGHTNTCIDLSPYKFLGQGGAGLAPYVHVIPCPDVVRGKNLDGRAAAKTAIAAARKAGGRIAAFFAESIVSCGGQVVLPEGYLAEVYAEMRAEGALCVADEVQCGFGRVGSVFWAFQLQNVVPDIVTIGKPMGNGYPMAALVTKRGLGDAFAATGMEFFATFGGCTAAAAAGLAVLDVLEAEKLQENAVEVGEYTMEALRNVQQRHGDVMCDVRGRGLMLGVELVCDAETKTPASALAHYVRAHCKAVHRVLLSAEGPYSSVLKIKPPLCFTRANADRMVAAIADALDSLTDMERKQLRQRSVEHVNAVNRRREALGFGPA